MMIVLIGTMFCVTLSLLLTINDAASITGDHQLQVIYELLASDDYQLDHHTLPRKLLMVNNYKQVEASEISKSLVSSNNEQNKDSSGELYKKGREEVEVMAHAAKGTRQAEWIEASDQNHHEFFTMDYSHVRRRRPIHNKSFPKTAMNSP